MKKQIYALLFLGLSLYMFTNFLFPVTDPVECNYTLTAKEMLEAGDWVSPRIYGNYWYDKPAFFYWELMLSYKLFGFTDFASRFFPSLLAVLGLLMTYFFASRIYQDKKTGFAAALILGTTIGYWCVAKAIVTDMSLFLFSNAVLVCFYLGYQEKNRRWYYLCWLFAGFATLTKGPVGILLPGLLLTIFLICRKNFKELLHFKWFSGIAIFLLFGGEWYYTMYSLHGWDFLGGFLGTHNVLRATVSEHPEDNVWYYYLMIFSLTFLPWWPLCIYHGRKYYQQLKDKTFSDNTLFLLIWALGVAGFYQLMATKYITYTFPMFMPLSVLCGHLLAGHLKLVKKVAIGTGIFYTLLTFLVLAPLFSKRSGSDMAAVVKEKVPQSALLTSYGTYEPSIVYYSSHKMYRLAAKTAIAAEKPENMSWNIKNVMPFMAYEDVPTDAVCYVVCTKSRLEDFKRTFPADKWEYQELYTAKKDILLELRSSR